MLYAQGAEESKGGNEKLKIGVVTLTSGHTFWNVIEESIKEEAKVLDVEVIVRDGQNDTNVQYNEAQNLVTAGIDALILAAADSGSSGPCDVARAAGIPVFYLNISGQGDYQGFVLTNEIQGGARAGNWAYEYAEKNLSGKAKCAIISFDEITCCVDRATGFIQELEKHENMEIVAMQTYSGDTEKAAAVTQDYLTQFPDLDIIFAVGDPAAQGALEVVKAQGAKAVVIGYDGNPEAATAIMDPVDGKIWKADVVQDPATEAKDVLNLAVDYISGKTINSENLVDTYMMDISTLSN